MTAMGSFYDAIDPASLSEATFLATENVTIDARLQAVFVVREGVEVKVKKALAVALTNGRWEEKSE